MSVHSVVIFGGSGFVGRHLANRLTRDGVSIRVPTRSRESARQLWMLPTTEVIEADIHNPVELDHLLAGTDTVINLVGILNERGDDGEGFRHVHVELVRKILTACRRQNVDRYLHMSALNAAPQAPSHYLRSKGEGEALARTAATSEGLDVTIFRPSVIFGPDDSFYNRFAGLLSFAPVFPLAAADARFAPVYIGDVVEAMAMTLDRPASFGKRYELCGPEVFTLREIVEQTATMTGRRRVIVPLGGALGALQARVLELLPGKPLSRDNLRSASIPSVCSDASVWPELGLRPTPVQAVMPAALGNRNARGRYMDLRRTPDRIH